MINALFRQWDKFARPPNAKEIHGLSHRSFGKLAIQHYSSKSSFFNNPIQEPNNGKWIDSTVDLLHASILQMYLCMDSRGVSFFITAAGFVGLGPANMESNDSIVLPYGSRFPIVIRQSRKNWLFVGFVYVRGIINKELWDCYSDLNLTETEFVLE